MHNGIEHWGFGFGHWGFALLIGIIAGMIIVGVLMWLDKRTKP